MEGEELGGGVEDIQCIVNTLERQLGSKINTLVHN